LSEEGVDHGFDTRAFHQRALQLKNSLFEGNLFFCFCRFLSCIGEA
jgi:hypothetical protein